MYRRLLLVILTLPCTLAAIGGLCTYDGIKGTCQEVSKCKNAFTVTGYCPNDPSDVKCCLTKQCTNSSGNGGVCLNNPKTAATKCNVTFVKNRCPGPSDVQCCVFDIPPTTPPSKEIAIFFWINAFIPLHVEDYTQAWPGHPGKTVLKAYTSWLPIAGGCFTTDQRGFSNNDAASARMHSRAWVQIGPDEYHWTQQNFCDETVKVDCGDGKQEGAKTQSSKDMKFTKSSGSSTSVVLRLDAGAGNPLVLAAPDINYKGTLTVNRVERYVEFKGLVDEFPAFEAYVQIDGKGPYTIDQLGPKPGAGLNSLAGAANRPFSGRVYF